MPKTRKKRKKTAVPKGEPAPAPPHDEPESEPVVEEPIIESAEVPEEADDAKGEVEGYIEDEVEGKVDAGDEPKLRNQLQVELQRLQEEYKRQKAITSELERSREQSYNTITPPSATTGVGPGAASSPSSGAPLEAPPAPEYPEIAGAEPGLDMDYFGDSAVNKQLMTKVTALEDEIVALKASMDSKLDKESINEIRRLEETNSRLQDTLEQLTREMRGYQKEVEKTDLKLSNILMDLGFEETLDINKIPHRILVLVYETILNDVIDQIRHIKGLHDTELAVNEIIEDIRSHTSGGELFKYEHNRIRIPELAQYLRKKLISPKQIHITYKSILEKLLDYVPSHQPKNFKAMIKMQSQEYTVSSVIELEKRLENMTTQVNTIEKNLNKFLSKFKDSASTTQEFQDELENINVSIAKFSTNIDDLPKIIDELLEAKLEQKLGSTAAELSGTGPEEPEETTTSEAPGDKSEGTTEGEAGEVEIKDEVDAKAEAPEPTSAEDRPPEPQTLEEVQQKMKELVAQVESGMESEPGTEEEPKPEPEAEVSGPQDVFKSVTLGDDESEDIIAEELHSEVEEEKGVDEELGAEPEAEEDEELDTEDSEETDKDTDKDIGEEGGESEEEDS
ncbi:hypothetical protein [[Eubacterium] cellulosolvens]